MSENMIRFEIVLIGVLSIICVAAAGCGAIWILEKIIGG